MYVHETLNDDEGVEQNWQLLQGKRAHYKVSQSAVAVRHVVFSFLMDRCWPRQNGAFDMIEMDG